MKQLDSQLKSSHLPSPSVRWPLKKSTSGLAFTLADWMHAFGSVSMMSALHSAIVSDRLILTRLRLHWASTLTVFLHVARHFLQYRVVSFSVLQPCSAVVSKAVAASEGSSQALAGAESASPRRAALAAAVLLEALAGSPSLNVGLEASGPGPPAHYA
jgi:hypothetical protein